MFEIVLKGVPGNVRKSKENNTAYVDFLFMGGSISVEIAPDVVDLISGKVGQEMNGVISVRPQVMANRFGRSVTVFEPVCLTGEKVVLEIK